MVEVRCANCPKRIMVYSVEGFHYCQGCRARGCHQKKTKGEIAYQREYNRKWDLPVPTKKDVVAAERRGVKMRVIIYKQWEQDALNVGKNLSDCTITLR